MPLVSRQKMDPSYSLHTRNHQPQVSKVKKRKRRPVQLQTDNHRAHKYKCYDCHSDVYFLPGHELKCSQCASRIVEKKPDIEQKRTISAR